MSKLTTACVTGATGIVGREIVNCLMRMRYNVRALTRREDHGLINVEIFKGTLRDLTTLSRFLKGADALFHCAAELNDDTKMWQVNVDGTANLINIAADRSIKFFCHISSAGVIGKTKKHLVDETAQCNPQNAYEKSKWEAEKIVNNKSDVFRTVILRPTNVVHELTPGIIELPLNGSPANRFTVFVKGGECAHIVHAHDVARASVFFINRSVKGRQTFFVSYDHEKMNTVSGVWAVGRALVKKQEIAGIKPAVHLPIIFPHVIRRLRGAKSNVGYVRYDSKKLLSTGYEFDIGFFGAIKRVVESRLACAC